ncbi:MAG TPA: universal stress protein [Nitrososphaerales archaeon]|nr:universal stress protein [Nitrososphaerales archaeon]
MAFDGSHDSIKAVEVATDFAAKFKADLTVVHVTTQPTWFYATYVGTPAPNLGELLEQAREAGQEILGKGVRIAADHGVKARGELIEAPSVVQALVEFAAGDKADLVVVGSRGMTGFKRLFLGSVSSGLVTHAGCPVLVVR